VPENAFERTAVALSELMANAFAGRPSGSDVEILATRESDRITLRLSNPYDDVAVPDVAPVVSVDAYPGRGLSTSSTSS
jgi:hypothetical protein